MILALTDVGIHRVEGERIQLRSKFKKIVETILFLGRSALSFTVFVTGRAGQKGLIGMTLNPKTERSSTET